MTKKILCLVLSAVMVLALVPMTAFAAQEVRYEEVSSFSANGEYVIVYDDGTAKHMLGISGSAVTTVDVTVTSDSFGTILSSDAGITLWTAVTELQTPSGYSTSGKYNLKNGSKYLLIEDMYDSYSMSVSSGSKHKKYWFAIDSNGVVYAGNGSEIGYEGGFKGVASGSGVAVTVYKKIMAETSSTYDLTVNYIDMETETAIQTATVTPYTEGADVTVEFPVFGEYNLDHYDEIPAAMPAAATTVNLYYKKYASYIGVTDVTITSDDSNGNHPWQASDGALFIPENTNTSGYNWFESTIEFDFTTYAANSAVIITYSAEGSDPNISSADFQARYSLDSTSLSNYLDNGTDMTVVIDVASAGNHYIRINGRYWGTADVGSLSVTGIRILTAPEFVEDQCFIRQRENDDEKVNVHFTFSVRFNDSFFKITNGTEYGSENDLRYEITGATVTIYDGEEAHGTGRIYKIFAVWGDGTFEYRINVKGVPNDKLETMAADSTLTYSLNGEAQEPIISGLILYTD